MLFIAAKNLPLNFFDDGLTQDYFKSLNEKEKYPRKNALRDMVISEYSKMNDNLKKILCENKSKLSFTIDGWSSGSLKCYYGVTVHGLNEVWELFSVALDLISANRKHKGKDIAELFFSCLKKYDLLNKIEGITVDNASVNTTFLYELKILLMKEGIAFDSIDQHFRCFAHILNLGVQDTLKLLGVKVDDRDKINTVGEEIEKIDQEDKQIIENDDYSEVDQDSSEDEYNFDEYDEVSETSYIVFKVRETVKKIRSSGDLIEDLKDFCNHRTVQIQFIKPTLDCKTRWNSSCYMLENFIKLKPALKMLIESCDDLKRWKLTDLEWEAIEKIIDYLKLFKQVSTKLSGEKYATLSNAVIALNLLIDRVEIIIKNLDEKCDRNSL